MVKVMLWAVLGSVCLHGCNTRQKEVSEPVGPATYDLRSVDAVDHPAPLPLQSSIIVDWKLKDDVINSNEGFRAWDVNRDGRFDMLEVLSSKGVTTAWAYDFDGDGRVDLVQATENAGMALLNSSAPIPSSDEASKLLQLSH